MNIEELIEQATCAVLINNKCIATAWLFDTKYLLTVGHIFQSNIDLIQIQFLNEPPIDVEIITSEYQDDVGLDYAILEIKTNVVEKKPLPAKLLNAEPTDCKEGCIKGYGITLEEISAGAIKYVGTTHLENDTNNTLLEFNSPQTTEQGFSGSAIYSYEHNAVIGMQIRMTNEKYKAKKDSIFVFPLYRIPNIETLLCHTNHFFNNIQEVNYAIEANMGINYITCILKSSNLKLLIGPECSEDIGYNLYSDYIEVLKKELKKSPEVPFSEYFTLGGMYLDKINEEYNETNNIQAKQEIQKKLKQLNKIYKNKEFDFEDSNYEWIKKLLYQTENIKLFTTNWDNLLDDVFEDDDELIDVIKLHGEITKPNIILSSDQLIDYKNYQNINTLVNSIDSDNLLFCIGFNHNYFRCLPYLNQHNYNVIVLLPNLNEEKAFELYKNRNIIPISLDVNDKYFSTATKEFLKQLLNKINEEESKYIPIEKYEPLNIVYTNLESTKNKIKYAGLETAEQWFNNWTINLEAKEPPFDPSINTVFIKRTITDSIIDELSKGRKAGITGLLGIGGVGKTYLAMYISEIFREKNWDVVWIGLLQQGTDEALDMLAACYNLEFIPNLEEKEKVVALQYLFEKVLQQEKPTLIVLDNAEKFPNLDLLLDIFPKFPLLVTSRTREGRDVVYKDLETMHIDESLELSRQLLIKAGLDFTLFSEQDISDLKVLCNKLGGHPLGIKLAISGYTELSKIDKLSAARPFKSIHDRIIEEGINTLPKNKTINTNQAGESIHTTIYATFKWLFDELDSIYYDEGEQAKILLPLLASLGTNNVKFDILMQAINKLRKQKDKSFKNYRAYYKEQYKHYYDKPFIIKPSNKVVVNEQVFTLLLNNSLSLNAYEKINVINSMPTLSQFQIDELSRVFTEEAVKFEVLEEEHPQDVKELKIQNQEENAFALFCLENNISLKGWNTWDILSRSEENEIRKYLQYLNDVSLIEVLSENKYKLHPLIREFAFLEQEHSNNHGPKLDDIQEIALELLSDSELSSSESLIDLISRLKEKVLIEKAATAVLDEKLIVKLFFRDGNWTILEELYKIMLTKTKKQKFDELTGTIMVKLGELQNRMHKIRGIEKIQAGIDILNDIKPLNTKSNNSLIWAKLYILQYKKFTRLESHIKYIFKLFRNNITNISKNVHKEIILHSIKNILENNQHIDQLGISREIFLSNNILDTIIWLENKKNHHLTHQNLESIKSIQSVSTKKFESSSTSKGTLSDAKKISPERRFGLMKYILISENYLKPIEKNQFNNKKNKILEGYNKAGIRTIIINLDFIFIEWEDLIIKSEYNKAFEIANEYKEIAVEAYQEIHLRDFNLLSSQLLYMVSQILTDVTKDVNFLLTPIRDTIEKYSANKSLGWLLLAESYIHINKKSYITATKSLIQMRKAFTLYDISVPRVVNILYKRAVQVIDNDSSGFENIRDQLSDAEKKPKDYTPWNILRNITLPKKVKNTIDNKTMLLIEGGLQSDENGKEIWIYPFYIDEFPVTLEEIKQYKVDIAIEGVINTSFLSTQKIAKEYAEWSEKELPNQTEWYIATAQQTFNNKPEKWNDWDAAFEKKLQRLESLIIDEKSLTYNTITSNSIEINNDLRKVDTKNHEIPWVWSEKTNQILFDNPINSYGWIDPIEDEDIAMIHCIKPIFTLSDMENLEVLKE